MQISIELSLVFVLLATIVVGIFVWLLGRSRTAGNFQLRLVRKPVQPHCDSSTRGSQRTLGAIGLVRSEAAVRLTRIGSFA